MKLDGKVLVLNNNWNPINIVTVYDAICKVYQYKAHIIDSDFCVYTFDSWINRSKNSNINDKVINTPRLKIIIPEIIMLSHYSGYRRQEVPFGKRNIYLRDKNKCQYCGKICSKESLSIDHVVPRSQGGKHSWDNIVTACKKCNMKKDCRTPEQASMRLISEPFKPTWINLKNKNAENKIPSSWKHFVGQLNWNFE